MFQISNTPKGYIVKVYLEIGPAYYAWAPIANFGDNQGDARYFMEHDAPKLSEDQIKSLIANYSDDMIFNKVADGHYALLHRSMEKGHYYITTIRDRNFIDAGTNRREAIKAGKILALNSKSSVELWHCKFVKDQFGWDHHLGRYHVGILEFPYHLRNCELDTHDITVNI